MHLSFFINFLECFLCLLRVQFTIHVEEDVFQKKKYALPTHYSIVFTWKTSHHRNYMPTHFAKMKNNWRPFKVALKVNQSARWMLQALECLSRFRQLQQRLSNIVSPSIDSCTHLHFFPRRHASESAPTKTKTCITAIKSEAKSERLSANPGRAIISGTRTCTGAVVVDGRSAILDLRRLCVCMLVYGVFAEVFVSCCRTCELNLAKQQSDSMAERNIAVAPLTGYGDLRNSLSAFDYVHYKLYIICILCTVILIECWLDASDQKKLCLQFFYAHFVH